MATTRRRKALAPVAPHTLPGFRRAWGPNIEKYFLVSGNVDILYPHRHALDNMIVNDAARRPVYTANAFGSKSGMTFNRSKVMYSNTPSNPTASFTRLVITKPASFPIHNDADGVMGSYNTGRYLIYGLNGQRNSHLWVGDSGQSNFVVGRSNKMSHHLQPEVVAYTFNSTDGLCTIWQNGMKTGYGFQSGAGTETNYFILGDALWGGAAAVYGFDGVIGDTWEFSRVLTDKELKSVSAYLMNAYEIHPQKTLVFSGHSNNTGYNIDAGPVHNSTKSWPYKLMTAIGNASVQGLNCAIGGLTLEGCDSVCSSGATTVGGIVFNQIATDGIGYNTKEVIHFFHGAGNTLLTDSVNDTLSDLQTYLTNRRAAGKNTKLYVIGELPISSTDFETNKVNPYNDAILNNLSTYTALGMTKFIDPRNITNMNTYVNLAANYLVADQIHLNDAGTTALSNYIKTESGL